jgi:hypothetical protein
MLIQNTLMCECVNREAGFVDYLEIKILFFYFKAINKRTGIFFIAYCFLFIVN